MNKAGHPFGMPMGPTSDAVDWVGAVFAAYGAQFVDEKGNVTVKSDATRQVLEWFKKLVPNLPPDVFAWDDASNNKALVSGKVGADHEPALGLGRREARRAADRAESVDLRPAEGAEGAHDAVPAVLLDDLEILVEQAGGEGAADLSVAGDRRSSGWSRRASAMTSRPIASSTISTIWSEVGPPEGTIYSYPPRYEDEITSIAMAPAPPKIAVQMYTQATSTKMIAQCTQQGKSIDQAIAWAADEIEGFMRG